MLKAEYRQLQVGGVTQLAAGSCESENLLLQIYNLTLNKNNKLTCFLSDGHHCIKAFIKEKELFNTNTHDFAIVRIRNHVVANSGKNVGIVDLDLVCTYGSLLGDPQPIHEANSVVTDPVPLNPKEIRNMQVSMLEGEPLQETKSNAIKQEPKLERKEAPKAERRQMRAPEPRALSGNVKDYQTIKGLFVGLKGWHLVCRVVKIDYQQFKKKHEDKMVRLLTIELVDRSEVKISGYFFYETADKFRNFFKQNSVYKISEGTIANESYNNSKNDKISPFKLIFNTNSQFEEVSDVQIIAKSEDSAITLGEALRRNILDQEFDILGVLVEIEEPREINKEGRTLTLSNWVIADPLDQKKIHAGIWNDKYKAEASLIGRTVLLSRFTLHNYNGSLTLNSKVRSGIQPATYAPFQELEEEAVRLHPTYDFLSERRIKEEDGQGAWLRNCGELSQAVEGVMVGETLKSDLDVFVTRIMLKKWYYEGCPGCNKAAMKNSHCQCGKFVEQTVPHFIMPVELTDQFGSFFTTAYDEQAKLILWEEEGVIHKMMNLDDNQLKNIIEDYYFQQFRVRVYTKRDMEGRIKHNMGRLQPIVPEKATLDNLEQIRKLMSLSQS